MSRAKIEHPASEPSEVPRGCTCLRLRKITRRVSQIYDQHLAPHDLTITQYGLLGHLKALDGIGVGALADRMVTDPTTVTRTLRPLQARRLVALVADPRDRRNRNLHLTDAGRAALAAARPAWEAAQCHLNAALGSAEHAQLARMLDGMLAKLADGLIS